MISDPPTKEHIVMKGTQCEFTGLDNHTFYKFRVVASNKNFQSNSKWSDLCKPNEERSGGQYKQAIVLKVDELERNAMIAGASESKLKRTRTQNQLVQEKKRKKKKKKEKGFRPDPDGIISLLFK